MSSERAPDEERAGIGGEHGEENGHRRPEAVLRDVAHEQQTAKTSTDPRHSEQRQAERRGGGLPHASDPEVDEGEEERREDSAEHPLETTELQAEKRHDEPEIATEDERA